MKAFLFLIIAASTSAPTAETLRWKASKQAVLQRLSVLYDDPKQGTQTLKMDVRLSSSSRRGEAVTLDTRLVSLDTRRGEDLDVSFRDGQWLKESMSAAVAKSHGREVLPRLKSLAADGRVELPTSGAAGEFTLIDPNYELSRPLYLFKALPALALQLSTQAVVAGSSWTAVMHGQYREPRLQNFTLEAFEDLGGRRCARITTAMNWYVGGYATIQEDLKGSYLFSVEDGRLLGADLDLEHAVYGEGGPRLDHRIKIRLTTEKDLGPRN